ncbi:MAG: nucleotidyltransferase domain-containing protein [Ruminococcus flavefaciens]|nr:nucleotidyltransferase domain-containing protein [Ruminococcus flavefaciens]
MEHLLDISEIKKAVSTLGSQYGAERIYLFGSYARGDAAENSDVDLRIDRGSIRGWALGGLLADLEELLQKKVDLLTTGSLQEDFLNSIKNEEVLLYEQKPE